VSRRARTAIVAAVLLVLLIADWTRPPANQWSARFLLASIHLYQATLSPRLGAVGVQCRFRPTCSHYGEGAIRKYGALKGSLLTIRRVARCGPWTPLGTYDPP
jgi:putative membrane protein insertion efficiency factor